MPIEVKEICYNLINSFLAGLLVVFGAFTSGSIETTSLIAALVAGCIVWITQFKQYWDKETQKITKCLFCFIK
jgi:hypothetical protein